MAIDLSTSRRTSYHKVYWWKSVEKQKYNLSDLVKDTKPSGHFYASEESPIQKKNDIISNAFRIDKNTTMIKTSDIVNGINVDDIVKYHDEYWMIADIQEQHIHKQEQFRKRVSKITYLTLRR